MSSVEDMSDFLLTFCSCPSQSTAFNIANALIEANIAACVTIQGGNNTSVYRWNNQIEHTSEAILLIKTTANRYPDLEQVILAHH
ncbi:hypothetical protein TI03_03760, partial [Achromatium sp. WMS1]